MKRISTISPVLIGLCLSGLFPTSIHAKDTRERPPLTVMTAAVESQPIARDLQLIGNLRAKQSVEIAAEIAGKIEKVHVESGQKVEKGALLLSLNGRKARASVAEKHALYQEAQRKLAELKKLQGRGAITTSEVDAQIAAVSVSKAQLEAMRAVLAEHQVRAPFAGTVGLIDISLGQHINAGQALLNLDDLSVMQLDVNVPEQYFADIQDQLAVNATAKAYQNRQFKGHVSGVDSRVDPDSLNLTARIDLKNTHQLLRPGMLMQADLQFSPQVSAIIPVQAIEYSGTKRYVYLVRADGIAKRTQVKLGARIDNSVTVESGLKVGDRIVTQGLVSMRDGIKVKDLSQSQAED